MEFRFAEPTKARSQNLTREVNALEGIGKSDAASRRVSISLMRQFTGNSLAAVADIGTQSTTSKPRAMFNYAESMKSEVRKSLIKPAYDVRSFYWTVGMWQRIARHHHFESFTLFVISLNALWISIDTDHNKSDSLLKAHWVFQIAEHSFCTYFSFEWFVRFMSFKSKRDGLRDRWFVFDSILVFMMVLETWVLTLVMYLLGGGGSGVGGASVLRLFRLTRLSRLARMLRSMPELMILIKGMMAASRSVFFTLCLLFILMYVFAIGLTQLCVTYPCGGKFFSTIPHSMYTLLIHGTLLDDLYRVVNYLGHEDTGAFHIAAFFMLFLSLAALMVMNMLIGVLCEVVSSVAAFEKEEMVVSFVKSKITNIINRIDVDKSGKVSKEEFLQILEEDEAVVALIEVGVDPVGLVDMTDFIFMDEEADETGNQEKELTLDEFLEMVLKLRGSNTATVKDVMDLRKYIGQTLRRVEDRLKKHHYRQANAFQANSFAASRIPSRSMSNVNSIMSPSRHANSEPMGGALRPPSPQCSSMSPVPTMSTTFMPSTSALTELIVLHTGRIEAFLVAALHEMQNLRDDHLCAEAAEVPEHSVSALKGSHWIPPEDPSLHWERTDRERRRFSKVERQKSLLTLSVTMEQLRASANRVEGFLQLILKAIHKLRVALPQQTQLTSTPRMTRKMSKSALTVANPSSTAGATLQKECLETLVWASRMEEFILLQGVDELEPICDRLPLDPGGSVLEVSPEALNDLRVWTTQTESFLLTSRNEAESMRHRLQNPGGRNTVTLCEV